jgi:hypothetical protein
MAISKAPSCEIRALVMHVYPDGIKAFGHERLDVPLGRRGQPVKKVRFMAMAKAHELARKLQGRLNTTISVI